MSDLRRLLRRGFVWFHQWLGLVAGVAFTVLAFSGGVVTFRPQIAAWLSPPIPAGACAAMDWDRAEHDVNAFANSSINRIYAPTAPDTRYRFRVNTDTDGIYTHVIYDACSNRVLGAANLGWMDWLVDFHHNLRGGRTGRWYAGWLGVLLLVSGISGAAIWLVSRPSLQRLLRIRSGIAMPRDLHSTSGMLACALLLIGSFTGLWLCFPQTMRGALALVMTVPNEARGPRAPKRESTAPTAGLAAIVHAAETALPGAAIREIRMPEGYGNVQVRMWRAGDFRSLGNNVVTVDRVSATAVKTDLYADKPAGNKFIQAMAGLHYGEWGGAAFRTLYGIAGLLSAFLLITGVLAWWLPKQRARRAVAASRETSEPATVPTLT